MKCAKCGYESEKNIKKFGAYLCEICNCFSPDNIEEFKEYINEKIPSEYLESFRKFFKPKGEPQKKGMLQKASDGKIVTRAPFGYKIENKKLVPSENADEVREIFEEFLNSNLSLRKLASKHSLSVNGLKKILRNFTYIGKIKFNGQIYDGAHEPIISSTLFNHVQNKLDKLGIKRL